jgi:inner membrane protein
VLSYPDGTFIPIAIATHALVGLTLGAVLFDRPGIGLVAGAIPDADFLLPDALSYPLVHRGISHTLVALVVLVAVLAVLAERDVIGAVGVGYASHLIIDVTTQKGIPLVYPLVSGRIYIDLGIGGHAPETTLALWIVCLGVLGYPLYARDALSEREPDPES